MDLLALFRRRFTNGHVPDAEAVAWKSRAEHAEQLVSRVTEAFRFDEPWGAFGNYPYRTYTPTDVPLADSALDPASSLEDLGKLRDLARQLARQNPFAINALDNLEAFIVGEEGIKYTASTKDDASSPLVAAVQDIIDNFRDRTIWAEWEQEIVRRVHRDGEAFLRWQDGDVRIIEPDWVVQPPEGKSPALDDPEGIQPVWVMGIGFDPEDKQTPLAYHVQYPGEEPECVPADEVLHIKVNVDRNCPRGLSDFFATGETLAGVADLLRRMRIGEGVRASIAGFWEYGEGVTASQVSGHVSNLKDTTQPRGNATNPITGKQDNYQRIEPGTFIHAPSIKQFKPPPASPAAAAQVSVEQACLRSIGTRRQMPEYMISGDASNANYSSTLISGSPFSRSIRKLQGFFKRRFLLVIWKAVKAACQEKNLDYAAVERVIEIQAEAPAPELANELEQAGVDEIDMRNGVLSKQTRAMRRGLDYEQEKENVEKDPVTPSLPPPGGNAPFAMPGMTTESQTDPELLSLARAFLAAKREVSE